MFETTGELSESTLQELKKHLFAPAQRMFYLIFAIIFACGALIMAFAKQGLLATIFAVGAAMMILEYLVIGHKYVKTNSNRLREISKTASITYTSSFGDDGVHNINHATGGNATIPYDCLCRMAETAHYIALFTKAAQFILVFKSGLNDRERAELIALLKTKPTKIKWRG